MKVFRGVVIITGIILVAGVAAANTELTLSRPLAAKLKLATCLHESPRDDAPTVICLTPGAELTLVARMKDKESVEGDEGYWYKAEVAGGAAGWVFSTFVEVEPGDDEGQAGGEGDAGGGE